MRRCAVAIALVTPLLLGCPTEVPYEPPASEAPSFPEPIDERALESPAAADPTPPPEPEDADVTEAADPAPKRFPWESDAPSDAPEEASELFADVEPAATGSEDRSTADESPAETDDNFGGFLDDAYADLIVETGPSEFDDKPEPPDDAPADFDPEPEPRTDPEPVAQKRTSRPRPTAPAPSTTQLALNDFMKAAIQAPARTPKKPAPAAKPPTTTEPADSDLLAELWGDAEPTPEPEAVVEPTEPVPDEPSTLPFGEAYDEVVTNEPTSPPPVETPEALPFGDPADSVVEESPAPAPEVETAPTPTLPEPEPTFVFDDPAPPPIEPSPPPRATPPLAASAIKPLPAVPVLTYNTRHLAWLLGGKLGLAELADLDGATASELEGWSDEVRRLAQELEVADPGSARTATHTPAERVQRVMASAASLGANLANEHGTDHAALLEIAFKSNALLVVAEQRPDLAGPVGEAIRGAADRAMLPRFLWEDAVKTLGREPTADEALDAVIRLHERVESFLR